MLVHLQVVVVHIEALTRHAQEVIQKIFLDEIALVAASAHEILNFTAGINPHDWPDNRFTTKFNRRFGAGTYFLADPSA